MVPQYPEVTHRLFIFKHHASRPPIFFKRGEGGSLEPIKTDFDPREARTLLDGIIKKTTPTTSKLGGTSISVFPLHSTNTRARSRHRLNRARAASLQLKEPSCLVLSFLLVLFLA